ncbi:hypothetical protein N657DRAFT_681381 [Parathielavia appendiculata]|uniref:Uncharacterized protein n=1 Tax=Parathielavia appendiculata TaxID=2587402 RepID=A0AAN6Z405_9PEZI|nr:hypothetical protein N657DRAFT_681381 [Parathielavia appendiculata]
MASGGPSPAVDLRAQVIENCEFFSGRYARISLVIAKEPLGSFKAIVLRTENGVRDALLSETAPSFYEALQALHVKSAEAVQNYIGTNGFAVPSSVKKPNSKHFGSRDDGHESDSASSALTLDECESLSDNETISVTSVGREKRTRRKADQSAKTSAPEHKSRQGRPSSPSPSFSTTRARSRSSCSTSSDSELHYEDPSIPRRPPFLNVFSQRVPPGPPQFTPSGSFPRGPPPPPPPPSGPLGDISTVPRYIPPMRPIPPPTSFTIVDKRPPPRAPAIMTITPTSTPTTPPTNRPPTTTTTQTQQHDIILLIRWRYHGERRALEQASHMTVRGIQLAALSFVQRQAAFFANVPPEGTLAHRVALAGLKAAVRSVVVDGVVYDLTGYAAEGDLTRLVAGLCASSSSGASKADGVPRFEVEVWNVGGSVGGHGEGVVGGVGVPVRLGSGAGGVSSQGAVGAASRMVFPPPPGVFPN